MMTHHHQRNSRLPRRHEQVGASALGVVVSDDGMHVGFWYGCIYYTIMFSVASGADYMRKHNLINSVFNL